MLDSSGAPGKSIPVGAIEGEVMDIIDVVVASGGLIDSPGGALLGGPTGEGGFSLITDALSLRGGENCSCGGRWATSLSSLGDGIRTGWPLRLSLPFI